MRIGIDARELTGRPTGLGRYLTGLLESWSTLGEAGAHEFTLFSPRPMRKPDGLPGEVIVAAGSGDLWWEQFNLTSAANRRALDVFFAPGYTAPLRLRAPVVLTVHDVSFCAHPEWFGWREGLRRRTMTRLSAQRAHTVLTVSDFSKGEIVRRLGVAPDMVRRVYNGLPRPADPSDGLLVETEPLVLYVGSIFNRRHVLELIEAFGAVARRHPRASLAIVGDNRTYPRQNLAAVAGRQEFGDRVRLYDYVDEGLLANLYRRARVFAFLSEYEGFGLTPLEALAAGVAPVLLDTPTAREICGAAACYVPDTRVSTVAPALERLLVDEGERTALLEHAPAVLSRYSWERAGRETLEALIHAAG